MMQSAVKKILTISFIYLVTILFPVTGHSSELIWQSPWPTTENLNSVWGTSTSFMFAVGDKGTVIHFDGASWTTQNIPTTNKLFALWGSIWSNIFAVGEKGTILRYDGLEWSSMTSSTNSDLTGVWGSSATDVFAVGNDGIILHFDGTSWSSMTSGVTVDLHGVWAAASNNVYAVGAQGTILYFNGAAWQTMASGTTVQLKSVHGTSDGSIYAVGDSGTILAYNGSLWSTVFTGSKTYNAVWVLSETYAVAVGNAGRIAQYNGSSWSENVAETDFDYSSVWAVASSLVFIAADKGFVSKLNDDAWPGTTYLSKNILYTAWGFESSRFGRDVYVMGADGITLYRKDCDGAIICEPTDAWLSNKYKVEGSTTVLGSWGYARSKSQFLYVVGELGKIYFFYPYYSRWTLINSTVTEDLHDVWGIYSHGEDPDVQLFAVGNNGTIIYYDGTSAIVMQSPTANKLNGVWGSAPDDFFAVGTAGTIVHYDGSTWEEMNSGTTQTLRAVWGTDADNVFAVGRSGTILHYNGSSWSALDSTTTEDLNCIAGSNTENIFAAGNNGVILKYTGTGWESIESGTNFTWFDVWASPSNNFFFVGYSGTVLFFQQSTDISDDPDDPGLEQNTPYNPFPEDKGLDLPIDIALQWSIETDDPKNATYAIYFGQQENPPLAEQNATASSYHTGILAYDTTYYWKIVVTDNTGKETEGDVWSFTTRSGDFSPNVFYNIWGYESTRFGRKLMVMGDEGLFLYKNECENAAVCEPTENWVLASSTFDLRTVYDTWGFSVSKSNFLYAVGEQGKFDFFDSHNNRWFALESTVAEDLHDVWGIHFGDKKEDVLVFAVGDAGRIIHYDADNATVVESGTLENLTGLWGTAIDNMFAAGSQGTILTYDGTAWNSMTSGTSEDLYDIWGSSAEDVFAVGAAGTVLHYDGSSWLSMQSNTTQDLKSVWGIQTDNVFAAGSRGTILKYDGIAWRQLDSGTDQNLYGIWAGESGNFFFVGEGGSLLSLLPPAEPWPADGATAVTLSPDLQWTLPNKNLESTEAITLDVYFGTEEDPPLIEQDLGEPSYAPERLTTETTYYWKIVVKHNAGDTAAGPVWSFTTTTQPCIFPRLLEDESDLALLRSYRDTVISKTPAGKALIRLYYHYDETLVRLIEAHPEVKEIFARFLKQLLASDFKFFPKE